MQKYKREQVKINSYIKLCDTGLREIQRRSCRTCKSTNVRINAAFMLSAIIPKIQVDKKELFTTGSTCYHINNLFHQSVKNYTSQSRSTVLKLSCFLFVSLSFTFRSDALYDWGTVLEWLAMHNDCQFWQYVTVPMHELHSPIVGLTMSHRSS